MACSSTRCLPLTPVPPHHHHNRLPLNRRSLLFLSTTLPLSTPLTSASAAAPPQPDTTITDRVFLDFSVCPSFFSNRTLGEYDLSQCAESEPLGRVILGLYGNLVPITVSNFKSMCNGSSGSTYKGTLVQKIFPGEFFVAGRQGRRDKGEVKPPVELVRNTETVDSKAFLLEHSRPGLVSLCLSENDDDDDLKFSPNYHNVEFLITTGPGPCPQLDSKNIVFGSVLEVYDSQKERNKVRSFGAFLLLTLLVECIRWHDNGTSRVKITFTTTQINLHRVGRCDRYSRFPLINQVKESGNTMILQSLLETEEPKLLVQSGTDLLKLCILVIVECLKLQSLPFPQLYPDTAMLFRYGSSIVFLHILKFVANIFLKQQQLHE
ncbi:hypothetical protein DH2020_029723 [Rehmannia glutinosa]|uniref:PPIase cyclophilin-type domain-containing protein n=1 Tax=Rehmannia glutinosa TaxID=99300 RepID=A0ABR0VRB7_REHGL